MKPFVFFAKPTVESLICWIQFKEVIVASSQGWQPSWDASSAWVLGLVGVWAYQALAGLVAWMSGPIFSSVIIWGMGLRICTYHNWGLALWVDMHVLLWIHLPLTLFLTYHPAKPGSEQVDEYLVRFHGWDYRSVHSFVSLLASFKRPTVFRHTGVLLCHKLYYFKSFKWKKGSKKQKSDDSK